MGISVGKCTKCTKLCRHKLKEEAERSPPFGCVAVNQRVDATLPHVRWFPPFFSSLHNFGGVNTLSSDVCAQRSAARSLRSHGKETGKRGEGRQNMRQKVINLKAIKLSRQIKMPRQVSGRNQYCRLSGKENVMQQQQQQQQEYNNNDNKGRINLAARKIFKQKIKQAKRVVDEEYNPHFIPIQILHSSFFTNVRAWRMRERLAVILEPLLSSGSSSFGLC